MELSQCPEEQVYQQKCGLYMNACKNICYSLGDPNSPYELLWSTVQC